MQDYDQSLTTLPVASMPGKEERNVGAQLELNLGNYQVRGASIGYGPKGGAFACTVGPISDETMAALTRAVESRGTICLLFPQPLTLNLITLERKEPQAIRIVGRIVESA
jgi:hypothetical protein